MSFPTAPQAKRLIQITGGFFALLSSSAWAQPPAEPQPPPPQAPEQATQPAAPATGPVSQTIWPGIVRWYPSAEAKDKAPPSLIVQIPSSRFGPGPESARVVPNYGEADGRTTVHITIEPGTSLYGGGVAPGPLLLNGRKLIAPPDNPADPTPLPWIVAVRPDGTAFGVLADTTWPTEIDLTDGVTMRAEGPTLPIIVVDADAPLSPVAALSQIAGWQELPPRWAFGVQLYLSGLDDLKRWREHGLRADAIWGESMRLNDVLGEGSAERWASLRSQNDQYRDLGVRIATHVAMEVPVTPGAAVYDEGLAGGHWLRDDNGKVLTLEGQQRGVFADVTRQATRQWCAGLLRSVFGARFDGVCLFVGTPTDPPEVASGARFDADADLGPGTREKFGNILNSLLARIGKDAMKLALPETRSFVEIGTPSVISQRYGYTFYAAPNLPVLLNASMSGQVMIGADVGAVESNTDGSELARNIAVAAMLPMLRLEAGSAGGLSGEPWTFSPDVEKTCREALERRSRLLPYIYTLALDAYRYGFPMIRPLMTADPANPALRGIEDAFLLGGDLLVRLKSPGGEPDPASILPGWRKFDFGEESTLLPEMYIRPGAIIPVGPVMQHDGEKPLEPLTLVVCLNAEGQAMGCLYEDDGTSLEYLKTQCRIAYYQATREGDEVKVRMIRLDGGMGMAKRKLVVRVLLEEGKEATAEYWDALDTKVKLP